MNDKPVTTETGLGRTETGAIAIEFSHGATSPRAEVDKHVALRGRRGPPRRLREMINATRARLEWSGTRVAR